MTEIETKKWFDEMVDSVGYDNASYTCELAGIEHPYKGISINRFIYLVEKYNVKFNGEKENRQTISILHRWIIY